MGSCRSISLWQIAYFETDKGVARHRKLRA
jgi:hypothetical protein